VRRTKDGKKFHAWVWKHTGKGRLRGFFYYAVPYKPGKNSEEFRPSEQGKWVRVKFVEVK
jgi:hypothetical protein